MDPIEAMARAMFESQNAGAEWFYCSQHVHNIYTDKARRVINHLSEQGLVIVPVEPTEAMCGTGYNASEFLPFMPAKTAQDEMRSIYCAMISAVKAPNHPPIDKAT